jgi:hypothetical protein
MHTVTAARSRKAARTQGWVVERAQGAPPRRFAHAVAAGAAGQAVLWGGIHEAADLNDSFVLVDACP